MGVKRGINGAGIVSDPVVPRGAKAVGEEATASEM